MNQYSAATADAMVASPDGKTMYIASFSDDAVKWYTRNAAGELALTGTIAYDATLRPKLYDPISIAISPDGKHLYVGCGGTARNILTYLVVNVVDGSLTYGSSQNNQELLDNRAVVASKDGNHVYVTNHGTAKSWIYNSVFHWTRNAGTGALTYEEKVSSSRMSEACGLAFNSDDTMAYVTSRFYGGINWLTRNASTGALTQQSNLTTSDHAGKSHEAIAVVVAKDDKFVYVFGAEHGYILWFTVNLLSTGNTHLSYTGQVVVSGWTGQGTSRTTPSTQTMVISPDGKSIYVSAFKDSGFAEFSVNTVTGAATEVKRFTDGAGGVDGLNSASCVVVTADGASVYVGSLGEAKVVQFSKNLGCVTCAVGKSSPAGSTLSTQCTVRFE